jgi:glycosyltransferase involved in cell wall biosynthesis
MSAPEVSVIVCTLNEEKRIGTCLRHLQDQDYTGSYEIIVADARSEDRTVEIAREAGARVVIENKRSIAAERQAGANAARGRWLLFTDADSTAPRHWIASVVQAFCKHPQAACVYGPVTPNDAPALISALSGLVMPMYVLVSHWIGMPTPFGSNLAIRRDVLEKVGGFNTDLVTCEDLDLARRCRQYGQLVLDLRVRMRVSNRRVAAWGVWKYVTFHLFNGIRFYLTGVAGRDYEAVR